MIDRIKPAMIRQSLAQATLACIFTAGAAALVPQLLAQQPAGPVNPATPTTQTPATQTPAPQPGQGEAPAAQTGSQQEPVIHVQVNDVNLIFTVTDKHGHFIPNLKQSDFALLDDRKAPARVSSFVQQTNLPLRVGIVIDASTSIRQRFQFEQQAATEFLLQALKSRSDRAFVMGFDSPQPSPRTGPTIWTPCRPA